MNNYEIVAEYIERNNKQDKVRIVAQAIQNLAREIKKYKEWVFICEDCGDATLLDDSLDFDGQLCEDCQTQEAKDQQNKWQTKEAGMR